MEAPAESVRIDSRILATYRAWSEASGRSLKFLVERALGDAAQHFQDGQVAGLREAREERTKRK